MALLELKVLKCAHLVHVVVIHIKAISNTRGSC
jgi:hypothetical protein